MLRNLVKRFHRRWSGLRREHVPSLPPVAAGILLAMAQATREDEVDCGRVGDIMAQYAEAHLRGDDLEPWMRQIDAHLQMCPECREEVEALLRILEADSR